MDKGQKRALLVFLDSFNGNYKFAYRQLKMVAAGVRDYNLHDNCIILFDGGVFQM